MKTKIIPQTAQTAQSATGKRPNRLVRRSPSPLALEQRFMFDGAAVADAVDTASKGSDAALADSGAHLLNVAAADAAALPSELVAAQAQAEKLVSDFLNRSDARQQMFSLFNGGQSGEASAEWNAAFDQLMNTFRNGDSPVRVELRSAAELQGAKGAFASTGSTGAATVYLNADWLAGNPAAAIGAADSASITTVLVEELGHYLDARLNQGGDTAGDEGEVFSRVVIDGADPLSLSFLNGQDDHGVLSLDGVAVEAEFASFNFVNAYEMVYDLDNDTLGKTTAEITTADIDTTERWADKEQNLHYFNASNPLGVVRINDGTGNQNFSGNDVSATSVVVNGTTYYGWISRPIKANGIVRGFYFWTDTRFTDLPAAQADGNQDGDRSVLNNRGFVFVVDQIWFNQQINDTKGTNALAINNQKDGNLGSIWVANVGSSSDRVDSALNSVLTPNSAPAAANDAATVDEGSTLLKTAAEGLLANDRDANNDALTVTAFSVGSVSTTVDPANGGSYAIPDVGSISINKDGSYTFTPLPNYNGAVPPITYTVSDGNGGTATAVLSISVTPVNDPPVAVADSQTINENTVASGTVIANDSDRDGDRLEVTGFSYSNGSGTVTGVLGAANTITLNGVTVGTLVLNANGSYSFTPAPNYSGSVPVFNYSISDGHGGTASSSLSIALININNAPVANADNADGTLYAQAPGCASGTEITETPQTGNVLSNDTDSDGSINPGVTHEITAVTSGTGNTWNGTRITGKYGVLTIAANGAYSYNIDETNADVLALTGTGTLTESFDYTLSEKGNTPNLTASSTLRIVIKGANNAPRALDDYDSVIERSSSTTNTVNGTSTNTYGTASGNVLSNDVDFESDTQTITRIASPSIYNYSTDFGSNTNSIKSYLSQTYVSKVEYTTDATPTVNSTWNTLLNSNGTNCSVSGYDSSSGFKIFLTNQNALSSYATGGTVRITLSGTGNKDGVYLGSYSGYTVTTGTSSAISSGSSAWLTGKYGSVNLSSTGVYTYYLTSTALGAGDSYEEQFTYTVSDGSCSSTAVLHVAVNGTTTLTMDNEAVSTTEDATYNSDSSSNLLNGDSGFTVGGSGTTATPYVSNFAWGGATITAGTSADHSAYGEKTIAGVGTLRIYGDGHYSFTPAANYSGPVPTVTYTATDGTSLAQATLTITIAPGNDASVLLADTRSIPEDGSGSGNVLNNDSDADDTLSVASYSWNDGSSTLPGTLGGATAITDGGTTVGTLTLSGSGFYTFTPAANWNGTVPTITYTTSTGLTSTLTITVTPVNDPPTLDLDQSGAGTGWRTSYTNQDQAVSIGDSDVAIDDIDDTDIESAVIVLTNPQAGDVLNIGTLPAGISANTSTSDGVIKITLSGAKRLDDYEDAIRAITFSSTGMSTIDRLVSVTVNDGNLDSNTAYTTIAVSPDNRPVTVMGSVVNEASPYVMFEVSGAEGQWISLELASTGSGDGHATLGTDFLPNLQYFDGAQWHNYTGGLIQIPNTNADNGRLLVRTGVLQDSSWETTVDTYETLKLTAKNAAGTPNATSDGNDPQADGTAQIRDDGRGSIFLAGNTGSGNALAPNRPNDPDYPAYLDDDRPVRVDHIAVNEASPWAMFTVSGHVGQALALALLDGTATAGDGNPADGSEDYGTRLEYWDGSTWTPYDGVSVTLSGATLLVRTAVHQDSLFEGQHTFALGVTKLSADTTVYGLASIYDDGTGKIYAFDDEHDGTPTITSGPGAGFDDDRSLGIDSPLVNEASDYVIFTITGNSGQTVSLQLQDDSSNGTVSGKADIQENQTLKIWDGRSWIDYNPDHLPTFNASGKIFVRVDIVAEQDLPYEGGETFKLNARLTGSDQLASGTATIIDDGTGVRFDGTFTRGQPTTDSLDLDDDRSSEITVSGGRFNENSPRAVFTVNAGPGQLLSLDVQNAAEAGKAPTGDNEGKPDDSLDNAPIYYSIDGGATWQRYTRPFAAGSQPVLVAVDISNERDDVYEGEEQFRLVVTSGNQTASAHASIFDDGTGDMTRAIDEDTRNDAGVNDPALIRDDDRPLPPLPPAAPVTTIAPFAIALPYADVRGDTAAAPAAPGLPGEGALKPPALAQRIDEPGRQPQAQILTERIPEQFADSGTRSSFALPKDAFAHTDSSERLNLSAKLADGRKLPGWVRFNPVTGTFEVEPPANFAGELELKITARDSKGNEASSIFRFHVGKKREGGKAPVGRIGFSDQLRRLGREPAFAAGRLDAGVANERLIKKAARV